MSARTGLGVARLLWNGRRQSTSIGYGCRPGKTRYVWTKSIRAEGGTGCDPHGTGNRGCEPQPRVILSS